MRSFEMILVECWVFSELNIHSKGFVEVHVTNIPATRCRVCQTDFSIEVGTYSWRENATSTVLRFWLTV